MATCLREAATAEAGNTAGGFFQQTPKRHPRLHRMLVPRHIHSRNEG